MNSSFARTNAFRVASNASFGWLPRLHLKFYEHCKFCTSFEFTGCAKTVLYIINLNKLNLVCNPVKTHRPEQMPPLGPREHHKPTRRTCFHITKRPTIRSIYLLVSGTPPHPLVLLCVSVLCSFSIQSHNFQRTKNRGPKIGMI